MNIRYLGVSCLSSLALLLVTFQTVVAVEVLLLVPAGEPLFPLREKVRVKTWDFEVKWSEEVKIPRTGLHFLRNRDFVSAATQAELSLPRQSLHRRDDAQQSRYRDTYPDKWLARADLSSLRRTVGGRNTEVTFCLTMTIWYLFGILDLFFISNNNKNQSPGHIHIAVLNVSYHQLSACFSYFKYIWFFSMWETYQREDGIK